MAKERHDWEVLEVRPVNLALVSAHRACDLHAFTQCMRQVQQQKSNCSLRSSSSESPMRRQFCTLLIIIGSSHQSQVILLPPRCHRSKTKPNGRSDRNGCETKRHSLKPHPFRQTLSDLLQGQHRSARATDILAIHWADKALKAFLALFLSLVNRKLTHSSHRPGTRQLGGRWFGGVAEPPSPRF